MSTPISAELPLPRPLPDGLILRRSSTADADQLAEFNQRIHTADDEEPDAHDSLAAWTRDLLNGQHPTHAPDDFTLVVEESTGKIVSAMNLISQTWAFDGLPLGVGRPELVGTDPAYRNRGLVRTQFDVIHAWSRQRGHLLQGITGAAERTNGTGQDDISAFIPAADASDEVAMLLLRTMVAAAAADGHLDKMEYGRIRRHLQEAGLGEDEQLLLSQAIMKPSTIAELAAAATTPALRAEVYAAARLAIEPDSPLERDWLDRLATALSLDAGLRAHLDAIGAPPHMQAA